jgi:hypothetical protein
MSNKVIAQRRMRRTIGDRRTFTATVQLTHNEGNARPHFSATGEERNLRRSPNNQVEICGQMHDEILAFFPVLAPVVAVHLADDDGVPMHAAANALYWMGLTKYQERDIPILARHLRISQDEATELTDRVANADDPKAEMDRVADELRPRWAADAEQALAIIKETT